MRLRDNSCNDSFDENELADLDSLNDKSLQEILDENPDLLVFPHSLGGHDDEIGEQRIFTMRNKKLYTYNIMGFLGVNDTSLTIHSRFGSKAEDGDYFLHYMLQKVFALNLFNLNITSDTESIWDILLICQLPYYLGKATSKGIYKEYVSRQHNDPKLRGRVEVSRHLKINMPFTGSIAYRSREHDIDNRITQLLRHTIEFLKNKKIFSKILQSDRSFREYSRLIEGVTPSYSRLARIKVIADNRKIVNHPLYRDYEVLRKICLKILRREGLKNGTDKDKVSGILFDGAWLWEEYLHTITGPAGYIHPENKKKLNCIYLYDNDTGKRFPDFYHKSKTTVLDAKYKRDFDRSDTHQLISYIHVLAADHGYFINPSEHDSLDSRSLNGAGGQLGIYRMKIPAFSRSYADFSKQMEDTEEKLRGFISSLHIVKD